MEEEKQYEKWENAYANRYYPNIYKTENGAGIDTENGEVKTDGILYTTKGSLDLTTGDNAYKQANAGLTAKQTFYSILLNLTNYEDASKVLLHSNTYWVASRYVWCYSSNAYFGLRCVADSRIGGFRMFCSNNDNLSDYLHYSLRPVVQLGSDVDITPSATASSETGTPHTINWQRCAINRFLLTYISTNTYQEPKIKN